MMSEDLVVADATSAQSFNGYTYVVNNPAALTDPSGLTWVHVCGHGHCEWDWGGDGFGVGSDGCSFMCDSYVGWGAGSMSGWADEGAGGYWAQISSVDTPSGQTTGYYTCCGYEWIPGDEPAFDGGNDPIGDTGGGPDGGGGSGGGAKSPEAPNPDKSKNVPCSVNNEENSMGQSLANQGSNFVKAGGIVALSGRGNSQALLAGGIISTTGLFLIGTGMYLMNDAGNPKGAVQTGAQALISAGEELATGGFSSAAPTDPAAPTAQAVANGLGGQSQCH